MKSFRIHPLFFPMALFLIISGKGGLLACSFACVLLHELAHYASAKQKGYKIDSLTVTPYGALLSAESGLPDKDAFFVCVAGPLANLALALCTVAIWWVFPAAYSYTLDFFRANIAIGVFNLLPLYPLDGGRMVLSVAKNKSKCLSFLRILSLVVAIICFVAFFVSAFFKISYALFLTGCMLLSGVSKEGSDEKYRLLISRAYYIKDCSRPLEKKELCVFPSLPIKRLLRHLNGNTLYTVCLLDENMKIKKVFTDEDLEKMFFFDKEKTVGEYYLSIVS